MSRTKLEFDGKKFGTAELTNVYRLHKECNGRKSSLVALTELNSKPVLELLEKLDGFRDSYEELVKSE